MKFHSAIIAVILTTFLINGCTFTDNSSEIDKLSTIDSAYPIEGNNSKSNSSTSDDYPYPTAEYQDGKTFLPTFIIPTPSSDKVIFTGQMLTPGPNGSPYVGDLYIGYLVWPDQENYPPLIKFSEEINPKAIVDINGNFYFTGIDPGEYVLIVYSLGGTYIVTDANGEVDYINGNAGELIDLGILSIH